MTYFVVLCAVLVCVAVVQIRWAIARRRLLARSWDDVVASAEHVDVEAIRRIAESYLHPGREQLRLEPGEMWEMMGGLDGTNRLYHNAEAILNLAIYADHWMHPEAMAVAEMIRRDGVRLKRSVTRMQFGFVFGFGRVRLPFEMQEAAAAYYLMRGRLVGLYEACHVARVPRLLEAV